MELGKTYIIILALGSILLGVMLGGNFKKEEYQDLKSKYEQLENQHRDVILYNDSLILANDSLIAFMEQEKQQVLKYVEELSARDQQTQQRYEELFNNIDGITWTELDSLLSILLP